MDFDKFNGLELMTSMMDGRIPGQSISEIIPMKAVEVGSGYVVFFARADKRHLNLLGSVHGGFAASVLDTVTGCAVHTMLEAGVSYGIVDLNIKMLKPILPDKDVIAEGRVIHLSKKVGVSEGTIKDSEGMLYAHATATCIIHR